MREFWILLKVNLINTFGLNKLKKKFANNSAFLRIWMPIITAVLGLVLFAFIFLYMYSFALIFYQAGKAEGILIFGVAIGTLICFMTTISKANSYLFESKDFDLLMSLPISPRVVIASKFSSLLFINYLSFGLVYIPSFVWYAIFVGPNLLFYLLAIVIFILGPLLVITICSILSYLLGLLLSKFKYKNFLQTIVLLIFFVGVMLVSFSFQDMMIVAAENQAEQMLAMAESIMKFTQNIFYPSIWAKDAILGGIIPLLLFTGISLVPFSLFIYFVGHNFVKANARARVSYTDKNFKLKEQKVTGQTKALLKREVRRYFSNSMVVLNTIVGPIMGTVIVFMMLFGSDSILEGVNLNSIASDLIVAILIGLSMFMNGTITLTASSISLEGKNFWILKSLPVKETTVFISKILLNLVIVLPFILVNAAVVGIVLQCSVFEILMLVFIPLLVNILIGSFGLYINLVFPKLEWKLAANVVKQGLSSLLTTISGMFFVIALGFLFYVLFPLGLTVAYILICIVVIILILLVILLLVTNGKKRYHRLKA